MLEEYEALSPARERDGQLERRLLAIERNGKIIIFCVLSLLAVFFVVTNLERWLWVVPIEIALLMENSVKFWALKNFRQKITCYVLDTVLLLALTYLSDGTLISTFYIIILSEYYLSQRSLRGSFFMFVCDSVAYLSAFILTGVINGEKVSVLATILNGLNDIILFAFHFLIFNLTIQVYRKNKEITRALDELNESNAKLQVAYRDLQKVTALEERQRIAKEIHDTAGHSITTVIMQTEAAKLLVENDPAEAKKRLAAANLQAKNALEELRQSVHVLSGIGEHGTLKEAILSVLHDSTDGTDIVIRSNVAEITLCDAKSRFLLNTLKEGISNGLRHGGATAFWFELKEVNGRVEFLLSDNGKGMELSSLKEGFGLSGMHSRAESLGGSVWFETEVDEGFAIRVILPSDGK